MLQTEAAYIRRSGGFGFSLIAAVLGAGLHPRLRNRCTHAPLLRPNPPAFAGAGSGQNDGVLKSYAMEGLLVLTRVILDSHLNNIGILGNPTCPDIEGSYPVIVGS